MTERANIKVDRETFERHNQFRDMLGLTWAEYLERARDTEDSDMEAVIRRVVREELERFHGGAEAPEGVCAHCEGESDQLRPHPDDTKKPESETRMVCLGCHNRLLG